MIEVIEQLSLLDLAALINKEHSQCEQAFGSMLLHAKAAGEYLIQAKAQVQHGQWMDWVSNNCQFKRQTAQNYIKVAKDWDKISNYQRVGNLREALALLSSSDANEADPQLLIDIEGDVIEEAEIVLEEAAPEPPEPEPFKKGDRVTGKFSVTGEEITGNVIGTFNSGVDGQTTTVLDDNDTVWGLKPDTLEYRAQPGDRVSHRRAGDPDVATDIGTVIRVDEEKDKAYVKWDNEVRDRPVPYHLNNLIPAREPEQEAEDLPPPPNKLAVHHSSETPEHYTPKEILDLVIQCMGGIDLDPCSNSHTDPNVPATKHYTKDDDGLSQPWEVPNRKNKVRVFLNPPYGRGIEEWISKLVKEYTEGQVSEAIALVPARTDTQWFVQLHDYSCCLVAGRLRFIGNDNAAPFPSAVFYLGKDKSKFWKTFNLIGDIWERVHPDRFGGKAS